MSRINDRSTKHDAESLDEDNDERMKHVKIDTTKNDSKVINDDDSTSDSSTSETNRNILANLRLAVLAKKPPVANIEIDLNSVTSQQLGTRPPGPPPKPPHQFYTNPAFSQSNLTINQNEIENPTTLPKHVALSWKGVSVEAPTGTFFQNCISTFKITMKPKVKTILKRVHGTVEPGQMLAMMGASGSGKTTLLNVLNFRSGSNLKVVGEIMINGTPIDAKKMSMISCYIQQDDLFFGTLTVKEHLEFHAILRMGRNVSIERKRQRVYEVLREFNLEICKDVKIGIPGRIKGISGGQMRRLSFASEILTDPPLLFCDEPTSGLDAYMAKSIVKCLQKMAQNGKTIVCTIHQPSSETFQLFDQVCLLAEGRVAYFGNRENALTYFERNLSLNCPQFTNPADFYMDVLGVDVTNEADSRLKIQHYCDVFRNSQENYILTERIQNLPKERFIVPPRYSPYKASWITQLILLIKRCYLNYFRNYKVVINDVLMSILTAILGGIIYFHSAEKVNGICTFDQKTSENISTALFYTVTVMTVLSFLAAAMMFPAEIPIFLREHRTAVYRSDTYYIAKTVSEIPVYILLPLLFATVIYFMVQFGCGDKNYGLFLFSLILIANASLSLGHVVSVSSSNATMAISLAAPVLAIQMLFCGFFLKKVSNTPKFFRIFKYLSVFNYGYDLLMINQWEKVEGLICEKNSTTLGPCYNNGQDILNGLDLASSDKGLYIGLLFVLIIGWRIVAYIILYFKSLRRALQIGASVTKAIKRDNRPDPSAPPAPVPVQPRTRQNSDVFRL